MSDLVSYGVECGNGKCQTAIILGEMHVRPKRAGDRVTFVKFNPTRMKCKACGWEQEYTYDDLRQFPLVEGDSGTFSR